MFKKNILFVFLCFLALTKVGAQEDNPFLTYEMPGQNLLKFNRFLINPTFSTVREDKSYFNLLHRNQSATVNDNAQTYFLSYSGRMNDRTGLGLSLFSQQFGIINNYGVLANYAYGVKLSDKSNFTFGANVSYYRSGIDRGRSSTVDPDDPLLNGLQDSNLLTFQPGINLSYGQFDFGIFAENLFDYNLKTNNAITDFANKTFSGHIQYTHEFKNLDGIFEGGRLMPLARIKKGGEKFRIADNDIILGGSLILDLPKLGWVQGGYDDFYGAAAGIGFNLSKRLSLGYTMEKGLSNNFNNFGLTHEISFAYSITPNLTEDRVLFEDEEEFVENTNDDTTPLLSKDEELEKLRKALAENNEILAELMFRQDSIEASRNSDLERRFDMVMRMVRRETNGQNPALEEKAKQLYLLNNVKDQELTEIARKSEEAENLEEFKNNTNQSNYSSSKDQVAENQVADKANRKELVPIQNTKVSETIVDNIPVSRTAVPQRTSIQNKSLTSVEKDAFTPLAQQNNVKSRKFKNLKGVADGYYLIANVYKGTEYMYKFIEDLKAKGIAADYFENKNNGLKYVYLKQHDTWNGALADYQSNLSNQYQADMWIMNVENTTYDNTAYAENSLKLKEKSAKYKSHDEQNKVIAKDKINTPTIPQVKSYKMPGVEGAYYIIANVFASAKNANNFVKLLNSQGLNASYFINPENGYRYVYLKKHGTWNDALVSYYSKINSAYDQKMWIMRVRDNYLT